MAFNALIAVVAVLVSGSCMRALRSGTAALAAGSDLAECVGGQSADHRIVRLEQRDDVFHRGSGLRAPSGEFTQCVGLSVGTALELSHLSSHINRLGGVLGCCHQCLVWVFGAKKGCRSCGPNAGLTSDQRGLHPQRRHRNF